jgi:hypothetical protein
MRNALFHSFQVFLLALFFALIFKKADMEDEEMEEEDEEYHGLADDETWLHPVPGAPGIISTYVESPVFMIHVTFIGYEAKSRPKGYQPPDTKQLEAARLERMKELQMYDILRELLLYSFFLWILLVISYGFRDPAAFFYKNSLTNLFIDNGLGDFAGPDESFTKVR